MEPNPQPSYYQQHKILIIKSVLSVILITLLVFIALHAKNLYEEIFEDELEVTDTYRDILPKGGKEQLTSSYTFFNNTNTPIATFSDRRKTYKIFVYKLNLNSDKPIGQLVTTIEKEPKEEDNSGDISSTTTKGYKISNQKAQPAHIQNLRVYLPGDTIKQLVKNDSLLSYGLKLKSLKVYDEHAKLLGMLDRGNNYDTPMHAEILFLKQKDAVYVMYKLMRDRKLYEYNNEMYKLFTAPTQPEK